MSCELAHVAVVSTGIAVHQSHQLCSISPFWSCCTHHICAVLLDLKLTCICDSTMLLIRIVQLVVVSNVVEVPRMSVPQGNMHGTCTRDTRHPTVF